MRWSTSITVGGKTVISSVPKGSKAWRLANSIFCPRGEQASKSWLLLTRTNALALHRASNPHTIVWTQVGDGATTITSTGWYFVKAERVLFGGEEAANSLFLVEFADARWVASVNSDTALTVSNLRSYANTNDYLYDASSITWSSLVSALWTGCGVLGSYPGLPGSLPVDGAPEGISFLGMNAWRALCSVLDQLDCAVCHNFATGTYTIKQIGSAQTVVDAANQKYLQYNGEIMRSSADTAATLKVYFPKHYKGVGQEKDTEYSGNWAYNGQYQVSSVATAVTGAIGTKAVWDDLSAVIGENGTNTNSAALTTRANNRSLRYATRMTVDSRHLIYSGVFDDFPPGGQVAAVLLRNYDDGDVNPLGGTVTEVVCSSDPVTLSQDKSGGMGLAWMDKELGAPEREPFIGFDLSRETYPNYPRIINVVQVNASGSPTPSAGDTVSPNADGFHKGRVRRWVNNAMATYDDCWIRFIDDHDTNDGQVDAIQGEFYGPGRLSGVSTSDGSLLPVYLVRKGAEISGVPFLNDSGYEVPPYGVMEVVSYDNVTGIYTINRPTSTRTSSMWLVNGAEAIPDGEEGLGSWRTEPGWVLFDSASTAGDNATYAPEVDSWHLTHGTDTFGLGFQPASPSITASSFTYDSGTVYKIVAFQQGEATLPSAHAWMNLTNAGSSNSELSIANMAGSTEDDAVLTPYHANAEDSYRAGIAWPGGTTHSFTVTREGFFLCTLEIVIHLQFGADNTLHPPTRDKTTSVDSGHSHTVTIVDERRLFEGFWLRISQTGAALRNGGGYRHFYGMPGKWTAEGAADQLKFTHVWKGAYATGENISVNLGWTMEANPSLSLNNIPWWLDNVETGSGNTGKLTLPSQATRLTVTRLRSSWWND